MRERARSRWWLGVVAAAAIGLAAGCASGEGAGQQVASLSSSSATPSGEAQADQRSDEDKMREFAQCMREHGIDMADPQVAPGGGGGGVGVKIKEGQEGQLRAADQACRHLMPNGGEPKQLSAEDLDKMREFAKCLREHGLNVSDPSPNEPGIRIEGGPDKPGEEKFEEAERACQHLSPKPPGAKVKEEQGGR